MYAQVPVAPLACTREDAELHVRAFIDSFIVREARERWETRLFTTSHRIDIGPLFLRFDEQCIASRCRKLSGTDTWPANLGDRLGGERGVYFGEGSEPCWLTAARAATVAFENNAIWSLKPGRQALLFLHHRPVWLCERPSNEVRDA